MIRKLALGALVSAMAVVAVNPAVVPAAADQAASREEPAWLFDQERGRRYYLLEVPRVAGSYLLLPNGRVRLRGGSSGVLERQDEESLWVRIYEVPRVEPGATGEADGEPQHERPSAVAGATVDRLLLEAIDGGLPRSGQWRNGFDLADLDGDGFLDLVWGPPRKAGRRPQPMIFHRDTQSGGWRHWAEARFPPLPFDYGTVAAGDLNGDGRVDLALGMHLLGVVVLVGDGKGSFGLWSRGIDRGAADSFSTVALGITDWDRDGRPDLVALGEGPRPPAASPGGATPAPLAASRGIRVWRNQGDGSWRGEFPPQGNLASNFGPALVLADLDGDGLDDVVASTSRLGHRAILGFRGSDGGLEARELAGLRRRAIVDSLAAADLDGDGRKDLLVGYRQHLDDRWASGVDLFLSGPRDRTGPMAPPAYRAAALVRTSGRAGFRALAAGDLDGDGALDLAVGSGDGDVRLFLGFGDGTFVEETDGPAPAEPGCICHALRIADLDGDARGELLAAFAGEASAAPILDDSGTNGCPGEGALRAWKTVSLPPPA